MIHDHQETSGYPQKFDIGLPTQGTFLPPESGHVTLFQTSTLSGHGRNRLGNAQAPLLPLASSGKNIPCPANFPAYEAKL